MSLRASSEKSTNSARASSPSSSSFGEALGRIPSLDGLRAICVAVVIASHSMKSVGRDAPGLLPLFKLFSSNGLGVLVFFIISGFLITQLLLREYAQSGRISLGRFYMRRALRIFPAFYAYLAVVFLMWRFGCFETSPSNFWSAALYVWNYKFAWNPSNDAGDTLLTHIWSLSVEEQFYLLWPVSLLALKPVRACRVALAIILIMPFSRLVTSILLPQYRQNLNYMTHTILDNLMFGCVGALLWENPRFQALLEKLDRWRAPLIGFIFVMFISAQLKSVLGGKYFFLAGLSLEGLSNTLIIFWCIRHWNSWPGRLLNHPVLVHFGVLSYSLYLWQELFLFYPMDAWPGIFPYNYLCIFAAAELSYWLIERPFLRLRHHFSATARPPASSTTLPTP